MFQHCIILNGPPGSGKDTIANLFTELNYPKFNKHQFKEQLYIDTAMHFGVDVYDFVERASHREFKEMPWGPLSYFGENDEILRCFSPREALIHVSEDLTKPVKGEDYFGKAAAMACIKANSNYAVFSDGGFRTEIEPMLDIYQRLTIVHLFRDGFSFAGDSRNYITDFPHLVLPIELQENAPELAVHQILVALALKNSEAA